MSTDVPERRQTDLHLKALCARMQSVEDTLPLLQADIAANTALTQRVEQNTAVIVEAWRSLEGAVRVLRAIGRVAKPIGYILIAISAGWAIVKAIVTGAPPPTPGGHP